MKSFLHNLHKFFTIENPFLIISLLIFIVLTRFQVTYFNPEHSVKAPDVGFYAGKNVGHDLFFATTDQAARMIKGLPMQLDVGYGYTFTLLTAWVLNFFNWSGICNSNDPVSCHFLFYKVIVSVALLGFFLLPFFLIKDTNRRVLGLIFLITFLLSVPGGMGLESGNLDIILSLSYGILLVLQRTALENKKSIFYPLVIGIIAGAMLQTKLFLLPIALLFLIVSTKPHLTLLSFITTVCLITILPGLYGVPINPFYTIQAAQTLQSAINFSNGIVYGNNSTRAIAGGFVFAFNQKNHNESIRNILIQSGGLVLFLGVMISPVVALLPRIVQKIKNLSVSHRLDYQLFIVGNCYAVTAMILWPEISLGYRLYYLVPLVFLLFDVLQEKTAKQLLAFALTALFIKAAFIWHARVQHLFLLLFFYLFLMTSLSQWITAPVRSNKLIKKSTRL